MGSVLEDEGRVSIPNCPILSQNQQIWSRMCFHTTIWLWELDHNPEAEKYPWQLIIKLSQNNVQHQTNRQSHKLTLQVQQRQLRFVGQCLRRGKNDLINKYVLWAPDERHRSRRRGKPRLLYHEYIGKLMTNDTPPTANEMRKVATSGPPKRTHSRKGENLWPTINPYYLQPIDDEMMMMIMNGLYW